MKLNLFRCLWKCHSSSGIRGVVSGMPAAGHMSLPWLEQCSLAGLALGEGWLVVVRQRCLPLVHGGSGIKECMQPYTRTSHKDVKL